MSRDSRFDILRALVILNAIAIHFHLEFDLGKLALPSQMLQGGLFSVGGFFFFTGGYMAERVYQPRFQSQPGKLTRRLLQKGGSILGLYGLFLVVMYGLTGLELPATVLETIFQPRFYTEVLLTFGVLFSLIPAILWLRIRYSGAIAILLLVCSGLFLIYPTLDSPSLWLDYLCDRTVTLYPLLTALMSFCVGSLCAQWDDRTQASQKPAFQYGALAFICLHLLILTSSKSYLAIIVEQPFYTFFELGMPYLAIAALSPLLNIPQLNTLLTWPPFLALGIESLLSFMVANGAIVLLPFSPDVAMGLKLIVLVGLILGVGGLAHTKNLQKRRKKSASH